MKTLLKSFLGDPELKTLKRYQSMIVEINALEAEYKKLSDSKLKAKTEEFKTRLEDEDVDSLLPEAFAAVREAASRSLGQRHYDVQLIGGICLHEGKIAEMRTGEGKTLVATLPLYLNALTGRGVHLVTVNDYLAQLGAGWMGPVYDFLNISVGIIVPEASFIYDPSYTDDSKDDERLSHLRPCSRQEAYLADVTYGTNNEFGFDYLRDNMVRSLDQVRQRQLHYAIVDEVDSILIDEARTPLIISAPSIASNSAYNQFSKIAKQLKPEHYIKDEKLRSVVLTDIGIEVVEKILGVDDLYATDNIRSVYHLEQAMRAQVLFQRDKNYVVTKDGKIVIVDEFTGRLLPGRRYNEGLHQALEAKESVEVQQESMTLAKISFQNLFRLYDKLAGMTGTAATEREEFYQIYKLDVVVIPTNEPIIRIDHSDVIYRTQEAKFKAIVKKVKTLQDKGQPVLIGTASIEKNEYLSQLLSKANIQHEILNAKNNLKEALIVAKAGQAKAVTLATNIAGRGTDIVLGEGIADLGGLFVLGSERHESRRIDNQLRGRSGRQGDPGESQFFVSTEDDIMRIFQGDRLALLMQRFGIPDDQVIQNRLISKALAEAQKKVEGHHFDSRKYVVQYDDVMNKHRVVTYNIRRQLLEDVSVNTQIEEFLTEEIRHLASLPGQDDDYEKLITDVFPFNDKVLDKLFAVSADQFAKTFKDQAEKIYKQQKEVFGSEAFELIERDIYFQTLDNLWMNHLEQMDHMQQNVQWISVGQKDPLVEYRRQAKILYAEMQSNLRRNILKTLLHAQPVSAETLQRVDVDTDLTRAARQSVSGANVVVKNAKKLSQADFENQDEGSAVSGEKDIALSKISAQNRKKKRKQERQNRKQGRR
ncbi:MAG: preprotein translocase subunit SecA [Candidatus Saccharibacteria bacterium]|nr:preprotein translocase subunit SecA [Candidatus Saccharibacteria bacterium]